MKLMTIKELEKYLKVSRSSIYRLIKTSNLPYLKIGTNIRFERGAVEKWLNKTFPEQLGKDPEWETVNVKL